MLFSADSQAHEPRRSVRLKEKPVTIPVQSDEEEAKVDYKQKKKRFKSAPNSKTDNDIEIVAEKVAPIFLQIKKLEAEKAFKKAKQDFLQSSIPETLKQQVVLQSALEQRDVEIFPLVSHITQLESQCISLPSNVIFLNSLLRPVVNVSIPSSILFDPNLNRAQQVPITPINDRKSSVSEQNLEWLQCKDWIWHIKERHVNFPFFRCLRNMLVKGRTSEEHLWNDVCGTKHWNENLANTNTVHHLKQWLKEWKIKAGDVVEAATKKKRSKAATVKRKRIDSDASELDGESVDDRSTSSEAWSDSDQVIKHQTVEMKQFNLSIFF